MIIKLKPFSINRAWQGKRYKTTSYTKWRQDFSVLCSTIKGDFPIKGLVEVNYNFFIRCFQKSDGENFIKTTSDALVENGIIEDDRFIKKYHVEKFKLNDLDEPRIEIEIKKWEGTLYKHDPKVAKKLDKNEE